MTASSWFAAALLTLEVTGPAAQSSAPHGLIIDRPELAAPRTKPVSSSDIRNGGPVPLANSGFGQSRSPALRFHRVPKRASSLVIVMEDADGRRDGWPVLHWLVFNLSARFRHLPAAIPAGAHLDAPVPLSQGRNVLGDFSYRGPHPPSTVTTPHHYQIEILALDVQVAESRMVDRESLAAAIAGHVLATGELVATFRPPAGL